jgi:hypothetical protein
VSQLPDGEFGLARRKPSSKRLDSGPSAVDVAVVAATAVLDLLMPQVTDETLAAGLVIEAAQDVRSSLEDAGMSGEESLEAGRRVSANVARWMPGGRGLYIPRKRWTRR